jgi:hypothetical protein
MTVRALVAGWFSFELMGATAGDLLARDVVCSWLEEAAYPYDVAHAPPFSGGVDWREVDPAGYTDLVFVCGPIGNGPPVDELLERFSGSRRLGVDLTMLHRLEEWNPFDVLLERDSDRTARPDISLLAPPRVVAIVGLVLIHPQEEYGQRDVRARANAALERLAAGREAARVPIDTRLDENLTGLRTPAEVESLLARMDVVLTTRLHGLVLSLKNGVPVVAVDPVAGGDKISRQAGALGWPHVFAGDALSEARLEAALDACLEPEARVLARTCADRARESLAAVRHTFVDAVADAR